MINLLLLIGLGLCSSYQDIKTHKIPNSLVAFFAIIGIINTLIFGMISFAQWGWLVGIILLMFLMYRCRWIGAGDGKLALTYAIIGMTWLNLENVILFCIVTALSGYLSIIIFNHRRVNLAHLGRRDILLVALSVIANSFLVNSLGLAFFPSVALVLAIAYIIGRLPFNHQMGLYFAMLVLGLYLKGFDKQIAIVAVSSSVIVMMTRLVMQSKKDQEIAFAPFLFLGAILVVIYPLLG